MLSTLQDWIGNWKQLKQWALHRSSGAPADIVEGGIYYDDTEHKPYYNDGIINVPIGGTSDHELLANLIGGDVTGHSHLIPATATKVEAYGQANGMVISDVNNYIPISQIPASLLGAVRYQGTWNASTNTPTLAQPPSATTKGYYYITSVAGTFNSVTYNISDWIISDGTAWQKIDNTDAVTSVAGRTGAVVLTKTDVGLSNVDNTSDINKPISSATQTALNAKVTANGAITGATKTKITYDAKGLVTGGSDITKTDVGLGNVDNTSDTNKPISTATQTALNAKQNLLTFDTVPTGGSSNPVTSNGVFDALAGKAPTPVSITAWTEGVPHYSDGGISYYFPRDVLYWNMLSVLDITVEGGTGVSSQYSAKVSFNLKCQGGEVTMAFTVLEGFNYEGKLKWRYDADAVNYYYTLSIYIPAYATLGVIVRDGITPNIFTNAIVTTNAATNALSGPYAPTAPAGSNDNTVANTAWVRGRLADTTVGNADKVDGYHIVYTTYAGKGSASDTFYFTFG